MEARSFLSFEVNPSPQAPAFLCLALRGGGEHLALWVVANPLRMKLGALEVAGRGQILSFNGSKRKRAPAPPPVKKRRQPLFALDLGWSTKSFSSNSQNGLVFFVSAGVAKDARE